MKWLEVKGARVQVDDDVWEWARAHKWFLRCGYPCRYVRGTGYGKGDGEERYLHREVAQCPRGFDTHHLDENPLNCLRENLTTMTRREHRKLHGRSGGRRRAQS